MIHFIANPGMRVSILDLLSLMVFSMSIYCLSRSGSVMYSFIYSVFTDLDKRQNM